MTSLFTWILFSQSVFATDCSAVLEQVKARLDHDFSGAHASLILERDRVRLLERSAGAGVTAHSRFMVGSITKPFNAVSILRQIERGEIFLTEPVLSHLPKEFASRAPADWKKLTLRRLLNHTTGIYDYLNDVQAGLDVPLPFSGILSRIPAKLHFKPGSQLRYSNTNYLIAAEIVQQLTGRENLAMLKEEVIDRLGLEETGTIQEHDPSVYGGTGVYPGNMVGVGNLVTTTADLIKFLNGLDSDALLSKEWVTRMFTPEPDCGPGPKCDRYGFGFSVRNGLIAGKKMILHEGHLSHTSAVIAKVPELGLNLAMTSDAIDYESEKLATWVFQSLQACLN